MFAVAYEAARCVSLEMECPLPHPCAGAPNAAVDVDVWLALIGELEAACAAEKGADGTIG